MLLFSNTEMGNEESSNCKIEIDEETVEVTDNWSLHSAKDVNENVKTLSAFVSQPKTSQDDFIPLERLAKNLMIHRHPYILKFITSWKQNRKFYLITEEVMPLSVVLPSQSALKICSGLHNLLSALVFLHEKAKASHNNICCASVYVTNEGIWKLGGLEYLKKFSEMTSNYLRETRVFRYEKAVSPEEDSLHPDGNLDSKAIDKYAFGVLVDELLKKNTNDEIPLLLEFREYCKKNLQSSNPNERVSFSEVLSHPFFNHSFIKISRFLFDLPLKSNYEKEQFFRELTEQLHLLPEDVVGSQLASALLSRIVFLDCTAQKHFLPFILKPKSGNDNERTRSLFSESIFKKFVIPKLLQIFCVRDAQIRLILLDNFHLFCESFTTEELKQQVLPELLVGIKDLDDQLVSMTLKALSQLVVILGASTVIGGKRGKLFTDGRPKSEDLASSWESKAKSRDKSKTSPGKIKEDLIFQNSLPERLSPDGGEDDVSPSVEVEAEGDSESWSDWDATSVKETPKVLVEQNAETIPKPATKSSNNEEVSTNNLFANISSLDIKSNAEEEASRSKEIDFFHDMEPVISKAQILSISSKRTKFDVEAQEQENNWGDWGEDWELGETA